MFFDENARAGAWRKQVLHCRDKGISISCEVAFAVAVADLVQLPDDLPLMPAVTGARISRNKSSRAIRPV